MVPEYSEFLVISISWQTHRGNHRHLAVAIAYFQFLLPRSWFRNSYAQVFPLRFRSIPISQRGNVLTRNISILQPIETYGISNVSQRCVFVLTFSQRKQNRLILWWQGPPPGGRCVVQLWTIRMPFCSTKMFSHQKEKKNRRHTKVWCS